ncbi:unnamed protein product [Trifolium pratense]|uniref:Uncharacterized protein n=1 Tax=Trifolium pratense TaxID=57577 RepID=A0ACB0ISU0_TRIPR|nr:unnamed protein product [Trifolium pratense]
MAYLDDQEIVTLSSPPITTETNATTAAVKATVTATVNILVADSTFIKSLFALAVFLSLSLNPNPVPSNTLSPDPACAPTDDIPASLVICQFYALTSFICSAITAFALRNASGPTLSFGRRTMLILSDIGFILGVAFLLSVIVDLAQMKLGTLSCGSSSVTLAAVVPLLIFAPLSLLFLIWQLK